jgi:hypothetical protein
VPPNTAARAGEEIIRAHHAADRGALLDMAMPLDAARQHQQPARIDDPLRAAEVVAERRNPAVLDADIAGDAVDGGDDRAAAHDGIECSHVCSSRSPVVQSGTITPVCAVMRP